MIANSHQLIGQSTAARFLQEEIRQAALSDAKVLITGESGSGKEVAARLLHAASRRASGPLVTINCAGVPDTLLESEFFGHVRGSFTGAYRDRTGLLEQGHQGTVFLDEIGEMSLRLQGMLLRFLETGEIQRVGGDANRHINVRIITASNRNLETEVEKRAFREDLFYRLNVIRLHVPSLRERLEDVPLLIQYFVDQMASTRGFGRIAVDPDVLSALSTYSWPGNVRELRSVVERMLIRLTGPHITLTDVPRELRPARVVTTAPPPPIALGPSAADVMFDRIVRQRETFWAAAYEPFMTRDVTRQQIRDLIAIGLDESNGDYQALSRLFNIKPADFKRFVSILRRYDCHVVPARAKAMAKVETPTAPGSERRLG